MKKSNNQTKWNFVFLVAILFTLWKVAGIESQFNTTKELNSVYINTFTEQTLNLTKGLKQTNEQLVKLEGRCP